MAQTVVEEMTDRAELPKRRKKKTGKGSAKPPSVTVVEGEQVLAAPSPEPAIESPAPEAAASATVPPSVAPRPTPTGPRLPDLDDQDSPTLDEQTTPVREDDDSPTLEEQAPDRPDVGVSGRPTSFVIGKLGGPEARQRYLEFIEEDPSRESALYYNLDDGTYAVVQGKRREVPGEWALDPSLLQEGSPGRWKIVEHFHPGIRYWHRLPSRQDFKAIYDEIGGGALAKSNRSGIRYTDPMTGEYVLTEFGFEKGSSAYPGYFWLRFLNSAGVWETKKYYDVPGDKPWSENSSYQKWFDSLGEVAASKPEERAKETGAPSPIGAAPSGDAPEGVAKGAATVEIGKTKSSASKGAPPAKQSGSGTGSREDYLRKKLTKALKKRTKHSLPYDKNTRLQGLVGELQANAGQGKNDEVLSMLRTVWDGLQDPDLVAAVIIDVWLESQRLGRASGPTASPLTNAAISLSLAAGATIETIPPRSQIGDIGDIDFFDQYVKAGVRFYDLNIDDVHGYTTHLIQDLVVDRALSAAKIPLRAEEFRALLGDVVGQQNLGVRIWIALYDAAYGQINQPEALMPALQSVLSGLE
jgi:hypothetical protein